MNETTWKLTQLRVAMLEAISKREWKRMNEISAEIFILQKEANWIESETIELARQLWPGARVGE